MQYYDNLAAWFQNKFNFVNWRSTFYKKKSYEVCDPPQAYFHLGMCQGQCLWSTSQAAISAKRKMDIN